MIKCNLAVLLAERGLKMADVINDTSLSKTAVRSLYYNESKGIQYDTLETLCIYLGVDINELLEIILFEINIKDIINIGNHEYKATIDIKINNEFQSDEIKFILPIEIEEPFTFILTRKFYNLILTLPENRRKKFIEDNIIEIIFNKLDTTTEENAFSVYIDSVKSNNHLMSSIIFHYDKN